MLSTVDVDTFQVREDFLHYRYLESPWLCDLDWSTKAFRGKALKTKRSRVQLLKSVVERMECEEEEEEFQFVISSSELLAPGRQSVHMPGYPE